MPKFNNRPNEKFKTTCGKDMWKTRAVAVVVTLIARIWTNGAKTEDGKDVPYVLIGKRGSGVNAEQGKWCLPCGYLDWNESGDQAAVRELWEETGVDVGDTMRNWLVVTDPDMDPRQNICLHYGKLISVNSVENLPKPTNENSEPNEVEELRWVKVSDIGNYDMAFGHEKYPRMFYHDQLDHNW